MKRRVLEANWFTILGSGEKRNANEFRVSCIARENLQTSGFRRIKYISLLFPTNDKEFHRNSSRLNNFFPVFCYQILYVVIRIQFRFDSSLEEERGEHCVSRGWHFYRLRTRIKEVVSGGVHATWGIKRFAGDNQPCLVKQRGRGKKRRLVSSFSGHFPPGSIRARSLYPLRIDARFSSHLTDSITVSTIGQSSDRNRSNFLDEGSLNRCTARFTCQRKCTLPAKKYANTFTEFRVRVACSILIVERVYWNSLLIENYSGRK